MAAPLFELEGASNFRSLAGVTAEDGRKVRAHVLLRSDELSRLSLADWNKLKTQMNLVAICDLRRRDEREFYPTVVPEGFNISEYWWPYDDAMIAMMADLTDQIRQAMAPLATASDEQVDAWVESKYVGYGHGFDRNSAHIRSVIEVVLERGKEGSVLVHCGAGKDRTGYAVAALLLAAGVGREAILDDYVRTTEAYVHNPPPREHLQPLLAQNGLDQLPQRVLDKLCYAHRGAMSAALDHLATTYGSLDGYLETALKITPEERAALTSILLEDA